MHCLVAYNLTDAASLTKFDQSHHYVNKDAGTGGQVDYHVYATSSVPVFSAESRYEIDIVIPVGPVQIEVSSLLVTSFGSPGYSRPYTRSSSGTSTSLPLKSTLASMSSSLSSLVSRSESSQAASLTESPSRWGCLVSSLEPSLFTSKSSMERSGSLSRVILRSTKSSMTSTSSSSPFPKWSVKYLAIAYSTHHF